MRAFRRGDNPLLPVFFILSARWGEDKVQPMVGTSMRWLAVAAALTCGAAGLRAQTVIWIGGANEDYETGGNYSGGVAPNNSGAETLELSSGGANTIVINSAADVNGIYLPGPNGYYNVNQGGSGTLTIGSGGVSLGEGTEPIVFFNVPIVLSANQTWSGSESGFLYDDGGISGPGKLTIDGRLYMVASDTYSGGTEILSGGVLYFGNSGAAGTGTLTIDNGGTLQTWSGTGTYTVSNPLTLGSSVTLSNDVPNDPIIISGTATETTGSGTIIIGSSSTAVFTGTITGPEESSLTFSGTSSQVPVDGGSLAVIQGSLANFTSLNVNSAQLILAPTGSALGSLGSVGPSGIQVTNGGYLGLDGTFATTEGAVTTFFSTYGSSLGNTISGSVGLDSYGHTSSPSTFSSIIDLSNFTSPTFTGLGSATSAIMSASILPVGGNNYVFGGGGGTLTLTSSLNDDEGATSLTMAAAAAPLTLILQGGNSGYTGGTISQGGVLIFDAPIYAAPATIQMQGGYVGYTEQAGITPAQFISLLNGFQSGVIGFDSHDVSEPVTISGTIDVSGLSSDNPVYLGTATAAYLNGTIVPSGGEFAFTGVKGGALTVQSDLTGENGLTIGLYTPIEANGSQSSVLLMGDNTFSGPVTFYSGILFLESSSPLGTGNVNVPDQPGLAITTPPTIETADGSVTFNNNISVGNIASNPGLLLGNPSSSDILNVHGNISDGSSNGIIGIQGSVELSGTNTYSGEPINSVQIGTILQGTGNPILYVTNSASLGAPTAGLQLSANGTLAAFGANVSLANPINVQTQTLTLGSPENEFTLTLTGPITGSGQINIISNLDLPNANGEFSGEVSITGATVTVGNLLSLGTGQLTTSDANIIFGYTDPTINNLTGDSDSEINLADGSTLTLYTTMPEAQYYFGTINGDVTSSVVKTGAGSEYLGGAGSYGGGTTISQGTLIAGNASAFGTGTVTVASGAVVGVDSGVTITNPLSLTNGAIISGTGTYSPVGGVVIQNGTAVQPGNISTSGGIGTLSFGTGLTFAPGGLYNFNVANAGGEAGSDYSTLAVTGTLNITATSGSPFTISLGSINPETGLAGIAGFNSTSFYSWTIASATSITNFNAADFNFATTQFQNGLGGGTLSLFQSGSTLVVDFTPVPEPSTWALLGVGTALAGLVAARRSRRHSHEGPPPSL